MKTVTKTETVQEIPVTEMETQIVRHGDVYLKPIDSIPKGAKALDTDVLLSGNEHEHKLSKGAIIYELAETRYVHSTGAYLLHYQHGKLPVPPGLYQLERERSLDIVNNRVSTVLD